MRRVRNVEVFDSNGAIIGGFWQCGTLKWDEFYRYINAFTETPTTWRIFQRDISSHCTGEVCSPNAKVVQPGRYILLSDAGEPIHVNLILTTSRLRNPSIPNTPRIGSHYLERCRSRDGAQCLVTGQTFYTSVRLHVAHIFPRAHTEEWTREGYANKITDTGDQSSIGGNTKIDSLQNLITLRIDLHRAWDNYEFGVDPNNNYRITSFTADTADINGNYLQLDHIKDPTIRPLDELFVDHFGQGINKHMKGSGEENWTCDDYEDAFGEGSSLSSAKVWGTTEGKERFELLLADRLFEHGSRDG